MSRIADFAHSVPDFFKKSGVDKLLLIAWYIEAHLGKDGFNGAFLRKCFQEAGIEATHVSAYLPRLASKRSPQLVKLTGNRYKLAPTERRKLDARLGANPTITAISKILADLPSKLPEKAESEFLDETLACYRAKAYRAATVMAWNLAYDHLMRWVLEDTSRLTALNTGVSAKYPKKSISITNRDDILESLKESEMIEACRFAKLISKNMTQILQDELRKRNRAAHPSGVTFTQHQADHSISELVNNVVLILR